MARKVTIGVLKLSKGATIPVKATPGSSGVDLHVCLDNPGGGITCTAAKTSKGWYVPGGSVAVFPTGLAFSIPAGYEMQVRSRSGLAAKASAFVLNSPGTIDSDYVGEVGIILANLSSAPLLVNHGDRLAQAVIAPVPDVCYKEITKLPATKRGSGGFGSTGVRQNAQDTRKPLQRRAQARDARGGAGRVRRKSSSAR